MINAQAARNATLQNRQNVLDAEMAKIEGAVNSAVAKGLMSTTVQITLEDVRDKLERLGYLLAKLPEDPRDTRGTFLYKISWKVQS